MLMTGNTAVELATNIKDKKRFTDDWKQSTVKTHWKISAFQYSTNGYHSTKPFSILTASTQPFRRTRFKCWKIFMPTTTRTVTATKSCTTTFKEKICLATLWQATQSWPLQLLEALIWTPLCLLLWLVLGSLSRKWQALKNTRKKKQKANFVRVEYKKIPDAIQSYLRGEYYNEKDFLDRLKIVDNFITDHCMETPAKTRDGKPQNSHMAQALWNSLQSSYHWTFQPHPCRAAVRPPVRIEMRLPEGWQSAVLVKRLPNILQLWITKSHDWPGNYLQLLSKKILLLRNGQLLISDLLG